MLVVVIVVVVQHWYPKAQSARKTLCPTKQTQMRTQSANGTRERDSRSGASGNKNVSRGASTSMPPPFSASSNDPTMPFVNPSNSSFSDGGSQAEPSHDQSTTYDEICFTLGAPSARLNASSLPDAAVPSSTSTMGDSESNRMSFSSLYSLGSAIYNSARGNASSGPPSSTGASDQDGTCLIHLFLTNAD